MLNKKYISYILTEREKETIKYLILGYSNQEIAKKLKISHHAIKIRITKIMQKINAKNRTHAAYIIGSETEKNLFFD